MNEESKIIKDISDSLANAQLEKLKLEIEDLRGKNEGSVANNILATISSGEEACVTSISGVLRNFLQHYLKSCL